MRKFDDVSGEVIGQVYSVKAALYYDDRIQCKADFYQTEQDAIKDMTRKQREIIKEHGTLIDYIYPDNNKWSIRIFEL